MDQVGLVTAIRHDQLLLLSKENASFAPPNRRPCPLYMLSYHRDRILAAAQEAARQIPNLEGDRGLDAFAAQIHAHVAGAQDNDEEALKVRFVVSPSGQISITSSKIPPVPQSALFPRTLDDVLKAKPSFRVFISPIRTTPTFSTRRKTTDRSAYSQIRSILPDEEEEDLPSEILMVNKKGDVMEGSITTPYFNHSGTWITPAASSGGHLGVTKRWALERELCDEGFVSMNSIQVGSLGERVVLSNGARGFGWGRVEPLMTL